MKYEKTAKEICYVAVAVALLTVSAWISLPVGEIPFTLQTLGVNLVAGILGRKKGSLAVVIYICLGLVGVPVFSGFTGGAAKLILPTGGYILGFIWNAIITGFFADKFSRERAKKSIMTLFFGMLLGELVYLLFGSVWLSLGVSSDVTMGIWVALVTYALPFLPFDLLKIFLALLLIVKLRPLLQRQQ